MIERTATADVQITITVLADSEDEAEEELEHQAGEVSRAVEALKHTLLRDSRLLPTSGVDVEIVDWNE